MDGVVRQSMRHSKSARSAGSKCTGVMRSGQAPRCAGVLRGGVRVLSVGCVHVKRSRDAPRWWGGRSDVLVGADQRAGGRAVSPTALSRVLIDVDEMLLRVARPVVLATPHDAAT